MLKKYIRTGVGKGWYWTPFTYGCMHNGWFVFQPFSPIKTLKWWVRYHPLSKWTHRDRRFA